MEKNLVSVIIPTYNGSKFLLFTVKSALQQTYSPIEIIVVDDGSTEDIEAVLQPVISDIRYFRLKNSGPAVARNYGIQISKGEYIAFLDHDDLWAPDKIASHVCLMNDNPICGLVYSSHRLIDGNDQLIPNLAIDNPPIGNVLVQFALKNRITTFSATLIRREVFDAVGYLNESKEIMTCDDYEMWLRIAEKYEVLYSEGSPIFYRLHDGNLLKRYFQSYSATIIVLNQFIERIRGNVNIDHFRDIQQAVSIQIYNKTREFAYKIYYENNDRQIAGMLFKKAIIAKPWIIKDLVFYVICMLPENTLNRLKAIKRQICGSIAR